MRLLLVLGLLAPTVALAQPDRFAFDAARATPGVVYHYLKTNLDGSHPEHVALYVAALDRIEVFKYHPGEEPAALVVAELDWATASARRLASWQVRASGEPLLAATMDYRGDAGAVEVAIPAAGLGPETLAVPTLPFHVYNFDLASLNVALPHLVADTVTVGLADPTFEPAPLFRWRGDVTITYAGEEDRDGVPTRAYHIGGPGLEGRGGTLWVHAEDGHLQDVEIALPDNPAWTSFKLRRVGREAMDADAWAAFRQAQF
jgi:hypothetical protein